ncbi:flagellar protein FlhE [Salinisphaera sp. LB1]|uniref:flagellar protein FlhE n=1 Tax=Salinisphaera sp. LB1 TaxID=2183911 RepID=UPI000D705914|nr:flagellar protein FlhE [Salinisphaera sp. LB1]AWN16013.1 Flagellar protein FlhE [Salinisphaera sp. LB1]
MNRTACVLAVGAALLAPAWPVIAAGSWVAQANLPAIVHCGQRYVSPTLAPRATTPTAGRGIRRVHWRYGYDRLGDPRMQGRLCAAGRCVDASSARGQSDAFAGLPVATPFHLILETPGTGPVIPVMRAGRVQLVVDFE